MAQTSNRFAIYIAGGRLISMLAGFAMPLVLVRVMPQSDYGVFSQFFTLYSALYMIIALGIHTNIFYFCPTASKKESDKYISNTIVLLCVFGLVATCFLFIPIVRNLIFGQSELSKYGALIILSITLAVPMNLVSPLNTIKEDKWGALFLPGFIAFARIATVILAVILFSDLQTLFLWLFIFQILIFFIVILYTLKWIHFCPDYRLFKDQLVYSLPFGVAVALQLLSNFYDKFVCIRFLSPADYAIYSVAFLSIPGITQIYDSLCQVNIVNMSHSYHSGNQDEILPQYNNFLIKTLSFSTPIILIVSLFAEEIMNFLYTNRYTEAAPFFRLYSLSFIISMFGAGTILRSMGKTKLSLLAFFITCCIGIPTTYFFVLNYGTKGAIIGAMLNIILPRFLQMSMEIRTLHSSLMHYINWRKIFQIIGTSTLLLIPFIALKIIFHFNIFICIGESIIYICLIYWYFIKHNIFIIEKKEITAQLHKFHHNT